MSDDEILTKLFENKSETEKRHIISLIHNIYPHKKNKIVKFLTHVMIFSSSIYHIKALKKIFRTKTPEIIPDKFDDFKDLSSKKAREEFNKLLISHIDKKKNKSKKY